MPIIDEFLKGVEFWKVYVQSISDNTYCNLPGLFHRHVLDNQEKDITQKENLVKRA